MVEMHFFFRSYPGERQIIALDIESIMTTYGFGVPLYEYRGERDQLLEFACAMGEEKWTSTGANAISKASTAFPRFCSRTSRIK
jgi:hypothetical protein